MAQQAIISAYSSEAAALVRDNNPLAIMVAAKMLEPSMLITAQTSLVDAGRTKEKVSTWCADPIKWLAKAGDGAATRMAILTCGTDLAKLYATRFMAPGALGDMPIYSDMVNNRPWLFQCDCGASDTAKCLRRPYCPCGNAATCEHHAVWPNRVTHVAHVAADEEAEASEE